ncbi:MAG: TetR family transcriptional regulator [Planctomycetota bacterium]
MTWQRARNPEQKEERIARILDSAAELLCECELQAVSMRDIAARAGLGKASLYHYFKTREEVFASLYLRELNDWIPVLESKLARLRNHSPSNVAAAIADTMSDRHELCQLTALLSSVLEKNVSEEFTREFKYSLLEPCARFCEAVRKVAPQFSEVELNDFMLQHFGLIAGLWPLSNPSEVVASVLQNDDLSVFRIDFLKVFRRSLESLLSKVR